MSSKRPNWHEGVFFGLHYDQHAKATDTVLGQENSVEHLVERLSRVRPDWIQCDCKGHAGYTSWPTKTGATSPGVVKDQVALYREATRRLGIPLGMHYSGVWDTRAIELHPEWARRNADGTPDPNYTCRLSAYTDELLIPQMLELVETYDIDGFWVDGENWASRPCWCDRCKAEFTRRTGVSDAPAEPGQPHWPAWLAFHRDLFVAHVAHYAEAVHARKPECLICSNWMYTVRQPDALQAPVDYLSGDYDWVWSTDRAAVEGRVLDGRALSWDLMAWGFTKSGDMRADPPWVMKTPTHLCQEVAEVVALGGAVMIYNTPQRTGWLTAWHQDTLAEVADFCRARKEACFQSKTVPQAAILHLADHYYSCNDPLFNYGSAVQPVEGALHALLETHRSADILLEEAFDGLQEYPLVVVPEQTYLSAKTIAALEAYARAGGQVILSGPHLAVECPDLVGVTAGEEIAEARWLRVGERAVGVAGPWRQVIPAACTEVWETLLSQQEPEKDDTGLPAVTVRALGAGRIVAIHGPVFRAYFQGHYPYLRRFLGDLVARLGIAWQVELDAPARLEMVLREKAGKLVVNLVNRGAGEMLMPRRVIVEELVPVDDVTVRVRCETRPRSVTAVPYDAPLVWDYADGVATIHMPRIAIHTVVVVE